MFYNLIVNRLDRPQNIVLYLELLILTYIDKGSLQKNVTLSKVVFKIHFKPFSVILAKKIVGGKWGGTPKLGNFSLILAILKFF